MERLAVLLTCYNRKNKTLKCLESLFQQDFLSEIVINVYLVDDGSTDGTSEAVNETYPQVNVIQGTGDLFWNGGMRLAFDEAIKKDYDGYIWLNDDTILYPQALDTLLKTFQLLESKGYEKSIIAASVQDPHTKEITYGGVKQVSRFLSPFKGRLVKPKDFPQQCDMMCGNFVLIPKNVVKLVGNLDPNLTHYAGDWDYGLRARQQGCTVWIAPMYLGICESNPKSELKTVHEVRQVLKKINHPKGLNLPDCTLSPINEFKILMKRHGGLFWPIFWLLPYRRLLWIKFLILLKQR